MACRSTATIFTSSPGSAPFSSSLRPLGSQQKQTDVKRSTWSTGVTSSGLAVQVNNVVVTTKEEVQHDDEEQEEKVEEEQLT